MLALFGIASLFFRQSDAGSDQLSLVGGFFAYAFLAFAVIVGLIAWRGKGTRDAHRLAERFLNENETVARVIGKPVDVQMRPAHTEQSENGGRLTILAEVDGPLGEGSVEAIAEKVGDEWRIVGGDLEVEDQHIALAGD